MKFGDVCNTSLALGLVCEIKTGNHHASSLETKNIEPSLTLGLSAETSDIAGRNMEKRPLDLQRHVSPQTPVSSNSNSSLKKEEMGTHDTMEIEKASSRGSDEDDEGSARKKLRLTKAQSALLEDSFKDHTTLNPKEKTALAETLNLRPRQVEVWFQNRRARTKLKQTETEYEAMKTCRENLTAENRRLHKELHELQALKLAQPLYMQLPLATLSMCPSCEKISSGGGTIASESTTKSRTINLSPKSHMLKPYKHPSARC